MLKMGEKWHPVKSYKKLTNAVFPGLGTKLDRVLGMLAGQTQPVKPGPVGKVLQTTGWAAGHGRLTEENAIFSPHKPALKKIPQEGNDLMMQSLESCY